MDDLIMSLNSDPELKRRFLAEPAAVLVERGIPLPAGVSLKVLEDRDDLRHIVLPFAKPWGQANLEDLEQRASKIIIP
ncbi:MAG: NHLP leader peptide family natural product precursor [bacterium]